MSWQGRPVNELSRELFRHIHAQHGLGVNDNMRADALLKVSKVSASPIDGLTTLKNRKQAIKRLIAWRKRNSE